MGERLSNKITIVEDGGEALLKIDYSVEDEGRLF
jgi:hypothetical protein